MHVRKPVRGCLGIIAAVLIGGMAAPALGQSVFDDVDECDLLAAHPADPQRVAEGVADEAIIPRLAVKACEAAVARSSAELRFAYQYGRALNAANRKTDARTQFERAARGNYVAAVAGLADLNLALAEPTKLTKKEIDDAAAQHARAAQGGFAAARQRQETLAFEPSAYTNAIVGQIVTGAFDAARRASDEPATRAYLYTFVTNLMGQCGPMLDAGTVARFALYRFGGAVTEEKENTPAVMLQPLVGEIDALRFVRRHGCEGPVPAALLFQPLKIFVEEAVTAAGTPEHIMLTIAGMPGSGARPSTVPPPASPSQPPTFPGTGRGSYRSSSNAPSLPLSTVPLYKGEPMALSWVALAGNCSFKQHPACEKVKELMKSGQQIISCQYGPANSNGTGFRTYYFWYGSVPVDLRSYSVPGDEHPFLQIGTREIKECPADLSQAAALRENSRF